MHGRKGGTRDRDRVEKEEEKVPYRLLVLRPPRAVSQVRGHFPGSQCIQCSFLRSLALGAVIAADVARLHGHSSPHLRFGCSLVEPHDMFDWSKLRARASCSPFSRRQRETLHSTLTVGTYRLIGKEGWGPG